MEAISRRTFNKGAGTMAMGLLLFRATFLTSCNNVMDAIENWAPLGLAAIASIVSILTMNSIPFSTTAYSLIKTAIADALADITAYRNTPTPTLLAKIDEALALALGNFQDLISALMLPNGMVLNIIAGLAQVIITTLTAYISELPTPVALQLPKTADRMNNVRLVLGHIQISQAPHKRDALQFKLDINAQLPDSYKAQRFHLSSMERFRAATHIAK